MNSTRPKTHDQLPRRRRSRGTAAMRVLAGFAALGAALALLAPASALASRSVYFSAPAFRECYISIYNPGDSGLRLDWQIVGGDATNGWTQVFAKMGGISGIPVGKNAGNNLQAGGTILLAYSKGVDLPGTFSGSLFIGENTGAAVASGVCISGKGVTVPFMIAEGQPF